MWKDDVLIKPPQQLTKPGEKAGRRVCVALIKRTFAGTSAPNSSGDIWVVKWRPEVLSQQLVRRRRRQTVLQQSDPDGQTSQQTEKRRLVF